MNSTKFGFVALMCGLWACSSSASSAPSLGGDLNNASAFTRPGDGGIDCADLVDSEYGKVVRGCIHEAPIGAVAEEESGDLVVVRMNGTIIASYEACPCSRPGNDRGVLIVPVGSQPMSYLPPASHIAVSDYDQACQVDSDCAAVYEGRLCGPERGCPNAAINRRAAMLYSSDLVALCSAAQVAFFFPGGSCTSGVAVCQSGVCTFPLHGVLRASNMDAGTLLRPQRDD